MAEKNTSFCDVAFFPSLLRKDFRRKSVFVKFLDNTTHKSVKKKKVFIRSDIQAKVFLKTKYF